MTDIVDSATRSLMMSGIGPRNTKPELLIRKALHRRGFRYRIHDKALPGKPDLVLPRYRAVIFIDGCFWHGHQCSLFKWPKSRSAFWREKIDRNVARDEVSVRLCCEAGWRVLTVHECAIKGSRRLGLEETVARITNWLLGSDQIAEISEENR